MTTFVTENQLGSWEYVRIDEILQPLEDGKTIHQGWSPRCEKEPSPTDEQWGVLKTTAIQAGEFQSQHNKRLPNHLDPRPRIEVKAGDVLLTCAGPRIRCGVACMVRSTRPRLMLSGKLYRFRPIPERVDPRYLEAFLLSSEAWNAIDRMKTGGSESGLNLTQSRFRELMIPVAPLDDQKRIVVEIEKQFSRLDEAVASLKRVKANLKRYKAAVLKAAVEGKLTEEWRKQNPDVEPASKLLERIRAERRMKWEVAELAKMKGKGKEPRDDQWKEKYKELEVPLTDNLPELPRGWEWSTFERLSERVTVGHVGPMKNEYVDRGVPFLRSQNVRENRYDPAGLKFITKKFHEKLGKSSLRPGDLAIVRSGSVGVTCVIPEELGEANCSDLVIVKQPRGVIAEYGSYYMNSIVNTRVAAGKVGVALIHFNTKSVAQMPVPVPPFEEQQICVNSAAEMLSIIESLGDQIDKYLRRSERLRSSILSSAFNAALPVQVQ